MSVPPENRIEHTDDASHEYAELGQEVQVEEGEYATEIPLVHERIIIPWSALLQLLFFSFVVSVISVTSFKSSFLASELEASSVQRIPIQILHVPKRKRIEESKGEAEEEEKNPSHVDMNAMMSIKTLKSAIECEDCVSIEYQ